MKTQQKPAAAYFYQAVQRAADCDKLFLEFVRDGLTCSELEKLILRRPGLWGRFRNWLPNLPETR